MLRKQRENINKRWGRGREMSERCVNIKGKTERKGEKRKKNSKEVESRLLGPRHQPAGVRRETQKF